MLENRNAIEYKDEAEWLELRKQYYTSTMTPALFDMSPYLTEFEMYHAKKSGLQVPFETNERVEKGKRLEEAVAKEVGLMLNCEVQPFKEFVTIPETKIGSSFDWKINHPEHGWIVLEIKCVDWRVHKNSWIDGQAPDHIELQVQHQMEVANCDHAIIAAATGIYDIHIYERERDKEVGQAIIKAVSRFESNLSNNIIPEVNYARDTEIIKLLYKDADGEIDLKSDNNIDNLLDKYLRLKKREKIIEGGLTAIKNEIHCKMKDKSIGTSNNYKLNCTWTKDSQGTLIEESMVGSYLGGKKGYRQLRITELKKKND